MTAPHSPIRDDADSIYTFDSITTSGRLLDRLDINKTDLYDPDFGLRKRDSIASIQTTGRLLDRLGLDDDSDDDVSVYTPPPIRDPRERPVTNPLANLGRHPSKKGLASFGSYQPDNNQESDRLDNKVNIKKIRRNIIFENANPSTDSIIADVGMIKKVDNHVTFKSDQPLPPLPNLKRSLTVANGNAKNISASSIPQTAGISYNSDEDHPISALSRPIEISRTPSAPIIRTRSTLKHGEIGPNASSSRRVVSEGNNSQGVSTHPANNPMSTLPVSTSNDLGPETRIKLANQLRAMGKHREASYQLQIAANIPNNYPKAMYQYAIALKAGQGVKQNDRHCIKWLCKCILIDFQSISHPQHSFSSLQVIKFAEKLNQFQPEDLIKLILKQMDHTLKSNPLKHGTEPNLVYEAFTKLSKTQINKIAIISKNQTDVVSMSYHDLGKTLFNGWGLNSKDEVNGIKLLSMAGSMGNVHSMIELGEIWSSKSKFHKKDFYKAAAWLRSSEIFGFKSIGNSWIYKEKYLQK
ncbi:uncharacterized protein CANTADRAFT_46357 [Suhomyces tanzawaensis NRRL Y-17324]|uniref:HCP-like protein n=1 Tax=Suhomyces tanzawaensis NRRL Y-17324 TaxID=984487 RepID=A0A1E4SND4_9ASCO|nr:uncharacterized protein CANTADRAFT_46357 [Suhomyces tanzawaensis NRRL Y-17324]ODV81023.1 hypothetical protein CANTADRAFT_46357 [Suhomyces tanzawaensis NRRL Y-17324]